MPLHHALVLAIVQGITEFLPISSSAHLALVPWLLGWPAHELVFDIALHFGTLLAVLLHFWRDWVQIVANALGRPWGNDPELGAHRNLLWLIALASLPVGIAGLLFSEQAETVWHESYRLMGIMLIGVGLLMAAADRLARKDRSLASIGLREALLIGLAQALAIVPGTSRSGITITAALLCGLSRPAAARFSFLVGTPAMAAASAKAALDLIQQGGVPEPMRAAFAAGVAGSALAGWAFIAFLLHYLKTHTLRLFVIYRVIFGIIVLSLAALFRA